MGEEMNSSDLPCTRIVGSLAKAADPADPAQGLLDMAAANEIITLGEASARAFLNHRERCYQKGFPRLNITGIWEDLKLQAKGAENDNNKG